MLYVGSSDMPAIDMWPIFLHLGAARGVPTDLYMIVIMCWPRLIGIMPEVSISLAKPFIDPVHYCKDRRQKSL